VLLAGACHGQQAQASGSQGPTPVFTLKVYANLVQVPTLVLDHDQQPLPRIDFGQFRVSLDAGKAFAPTRVRMEGEDPIDLAIVLDVSGSQRHLIQDFAEAAAKMASSSLHVQDHVSIYALNCNLVRSVYGGLANPELVRRSVGIALTAPALNKSDTPNTSCKKIYLWGSLASVVKDMSNAGGRRVILAVTDGRDDGSTVTWSDLHEFAGRQGVAIFGMSDGWNYALNPWSRDHPDAFRSLCESTGGLVLHAGNRDLLKILDQWVRLVRGRYVVEFPRPQRLGSGHHDIEISVKKDGMAFVSIAGVSVSLPDPRITTDPNYVPSEAGADIPVGTRRPLSH
jgi:hypothetical protein